VEGAKSVLEVIQQPALEIEGIYALSTFVQKHQRLLLPNQSVVHRISEKELARISNLKTPNQVLCICKIPQYTIDPQLVNKSLTLYLDGIQDPGNMGSILRIADWFGIPYIWCSAACAEVFNPKVLQASMGAFLRVPTIQKEFADLKKDYPDLPIFASTLEGQSVFKQNYPTQGLLVIGNEGSGIRASIIDQADHLVTIPKGKQGGAESLNAAVATGILSRPEQIFTVIAAQVWRPKLRKINIMKKIGLLSDTHSFLDESIFEYFKDCDEIWHAGDIGKAEVVDKLEEFKPLRAVYGNIDTKDLQIRFPENERFDCEGLDVWITHIGGYPGRYNKRVRAIFEENPPGLFICGHSHILKVMPDKKYNFLHMNPGACGHHGIHQMRTLLRFSIDEGQVKDLEVIELGIRGKIN